MVLEASALVVIDLLEDFFDAELWPDSPLPGRRVELVKAVNRAAGRFRKAGQPVIWVRQEFKADLSDAFPHMRRSGKAYTIEGTPGAEFLAGLDVREGDPVVTKKRFSAFYGTDLEEVLKNLELRQVFLAGITTSWCVRSTATDAYQRDFEVVLLKECLGGFSDADHLRDLDAMDGYIGAVVAGQKVE